MKKVFYLLSIFCITLFIASCTSSKKEIPAPQVHEENIPEQEEQEQVSEEEQAPEEQQTESQQTAQPEPEQNKPVVQEIPLPEEEEIFDEPEVIEEEPEEEPEEEYEDYQEEEIQSEIFEVSAEEEEILSQEIEEQKEEVIEVPEGFTAEATESEVPVIENVNLEELNALTEKSSEENFEIPQSVDSEEETAETSEEDYIDEGGMTDEVEVEEVFEEEIFPSRTMQLLRNQYVDVVYPGSGWVYLGETDDTEVFKYQGRKSETSRTVFTLKSLRAGTAVLHFYKNDILTGNYIDDYLEITVDEERTFDTKHIKAPSYEELVPERLLSSQNDSSEDTSLQNETVSPAIEIKPKTNSVSDEHEKSLKAEKTTSSQKKSTEYEPALQKTESSDGQTNIQKTNSGSTKQSVIKEELPSEPPVQKSSSSDKYSDFSSEELLSKAKKSFNEKKYSETLDYLDSFFDKAVTHVDEALYLKGQTLETKSEVRNIKAALEAYEELVKKYPQSNLWTKSNDRITYLKRFYFNIR